MIDLKDVTKIYDSSVTAVNSISFSVREGEIFGLIGTSGCGKTTTLKMINRLIEPTTGEIFVKGEPVHRQSPEKLRRGIGYVIQSVGLFPHYTISENIAVVPRLLKWPEKKVNRRVDELLHLVGLDSEQFGSRKPDALSGGQQQRIGLARALAADPPVVLMDEPFGALDPITKEQIRHEFKKLLREIEKTIVIVTHDIAEAFDLCDRVALMDKGIIQQLDHPRELLFDPANDFVRSFFSSNRLELEMQTVSVGEILEFVNLSLPDTEHIGVRVASATSLSEVTTRLDAADRDTKLAFVEDQSGTIIAGLTFDQLLSGFNKYRIHMRRGEKENE